MPTQKGKLKEDEKQAVTEWLYDFCERKCSSKFFCYNYP